MGDPLAELHAALAAARNIEQYLKASEFADSLLAGEAYIKSPLLAEAATVTDYLKKALRAYNAVEQAERQESVPQYMPF